MEPFWRIVPKMRPTLRMHLIRFQQMKYLHLWPLWSYHKNHLLRFRKKQGWSTVSLKERTAALRILHGKRPRLSCHSLASLTKSRTSGRTKRNTSSCTCVDSQVLSNNTDLHDSFTNRETRHTQNCRPILVCCLIVTTGGRWGHAIRGVTLSLGDRLRLTWVTSRASISLCWCHTSHTTAHHHHHQVVPKPTHTRHTAPTHT